MLRLFVAFPGLSLANSVSLASQAILASAKDPSARVEFGDAAETPSRSSPTRCWQHRDLKALLAAANVCACDGE